MHQQAFKAISVIVDLLVVLRFALAQYVGLIHKLFQGRWYLARQQRVQRGCRCQIESPKHLACFTDLLCLILQSWMRGFGPEVLQRFDLT